MAIEDFNAAFAEAHARGDVDAVFELIRNHERQHARPEVIKPQPTAQRQLSAASDSASKKRGPPRPVRNEIPDSHLPAVWGESYRALPNPMVRSGLFSVRRNGGRAYLDTVPVAAIGDTLLLYKGEELRVRDEDVLMQVYHFQREFALGSPWQVSGLDFLTALRWGTGAAGYQELLACLRRLRAGTLTVARKTNDDGGVSIRDRSFFQTLDIVRANRGSPWEITISVEPLTRLLWEHYGYTIINWAQRLELESPLSRWLHRFLTSHKAPFPYRVELYRQLCGSPTASIVKFRQQLKSSMQDLAEVGFLSSFWVDASDLVHVRRSLPAA